MSMNYAGDEAEFGRIPPRHAHSYVRDDKLRWVEQIARLMDSQFQLPGTKFRFGWDPILNLFPVVGGLPSLAVSGLLIMTMMRHGASGEVAVRMVANAALDAILGAIPLVGQVFDFAFKANDRNVRLLREHYNEGKYQGSGKGLIALLLVGIFAIFGAVAWATWTLLAAIVRLLFGA